MKEKNYEFVQRIESHYVSDDCIQIMVPHTLNSGITILNSEGMVYHYKPNSHLFINKYFSDARKEQFPYSKIPSHKSKIGLKKYEYVNQILDFNRIYIEIGENEVKERYAIKDGDEALLVTKHLVPKRESDKFMNRDEVLKLINDFNGLIFSLDGGYFEKFSIPTEKQILEWYKEKIIAMRERELTFNSEDSLNKTLTDFIYKCWDNLTIDVVPGDICVDDRILLVSFDENEIGSVKKIAIKFMGADSYKIESYDFPITNYTFEHIRQLEQTNSKKIYEPKFSRSLNKTINESEIKKSKQLILGRKNNK